VRQVGDLNPEAASPRRPVPQHLLDQLRTYPRLRDLVVGYLVVQERINRYDGFRGDLEVAGPAADKQFWVRLHDNLSADEGLRSDFPGRLLDEPAFEENVARFDVEHRHCRDAARSARNPFQSADSARDAYDAIDAILEAAQALAADCKLQVRNLLDDLNATVS